MISWECLEWIDVGWYSKPHLQTYLEQALVPNDMIKNCLGTEKKSEKPRKDPAIASKKLRVPYPFVSLQEQMTSLINVVQKLDTIKVVSELIFLCTFILFLITTVLWMWISFLCGFVFIMNKGVILKCYVDVAWIGLICGFIF